jgi:hypothetical protein
MSRTRLVFAVGIAVAGLLATTGASSAAAPDHDHHQTSRLTNLSHVDWLTARVDPPEQPGHTTYRLEQEPEIGVLWVYADHQQGGGYRRVGGGTYDPATDTYGQGAFDADDISRAAVVYLRHWRAHRDAHSREQAYQLLRGLTYLQTVTGVNAGNVVLWMQPDGTLNPSPTPVELPDPSDSGASYWLARTVWALGEGYAAFRETDPDFADFLRTRLELAIAALDRQVLVRYGQYQLVDGVRWPAWLIVDGADATAEAMLGLSAYVRAGGSVAARTALTRFAEGVAAMGGGGPTQWPYGAVLPWAVSRSVWHAWGAQMPSALANAATALGDRRLLAPAVANANVFLPHLLTATGPDNGWLPAPSDGNQIAYGADAMVASLLAVADATASRGTRQLAGIAAGWFFGGNRAGVAMYDPVTGITFDGVGPTGVVNRNSGAESTIHGLLTMQALDANQDVLAIARASARVVHRDAEELVEAEAATLAGGARVVTPASSWTGESAWSGGAYVSVPPGGQFTFQLPALAQPQLVRVIANLVPGSTAALELRAGVSLGGLSFGDIGAQGVSPAPGALLPVTVPVELPAGADTVTAMATGGTGEVDAVLRQPVLSQLVLAGNHHAVALVHSVAHTTRGIEVTLPGSGPALITSYDHTGRLYREGQGVGRVVSVDVPPGGFAVVLR